VLAYTAAADAAFPGANGKILGHATDHLGAPESSYYIFTVAPPGPGAALLQGPAENYNPSASPDGQKILWTCSVTGDLCTMNVNGAGGTRIYAQHNSITPRASFSPDGTKIVFESGFAIWVMNADGTGAVSLGVAGDSPVWSPDGKKIAFDDFRNGSRDIYVMNADGTGQTRVTDGTSTAVAPSWSPDGAKIAYTKSGDVWVIRADGTGDARLTTSPDVGTAAWSPDGSKIAFVSNRDHVRFDPGFDDSYVFEVYVMNVDGTNQTRITRQDLQEPGARVSFTTTDWQPIPINSYPRPRGASPMRISLVPANKQCIAPNSTHGAPLSHGSCGPPQLASGQLTTGTPDANGLPVLMDATLLLRVVPGNGATAADEADVRIDARLNDVFKKDLTDYTGALRASLPLQITDKDNTPSPGGPGAGTTEPFVYGFDIPCTPDPAANLGSDCSISTTADTLVPGTIKEGLRAIWQIGRVRVDDAGPDGDPDTNADNTVFATQGVFIP
jgi:Tol biopolymer transport system component